MPIAPDPLNAFRWEPQAHAAALVARLIASAVAQCPSAASLAARMPAETAMRFADMLAQVAVPLSASLNDELLAAGFAKREGDAARYRHARGSFPEVVLTSSESPARLEMAVESVADFLVSHGLVAPIDAGPGAPRRRAQAWSADRCHLWLEECYDRDASAMTTAQPAQTVAALRHQELFRLRPREGSDEEAAFSHLEAMIGRAIVECGPDHACALFFAAEREYWQRRNRAARAQRARQDALGLGWANHDHHTYRSSRRWFTRLIALFEGLGFTCRERFYPGGAAGWGAQVMEHARTGVVIFADVDMSPDELRLDFAHQPFPDEARARPLGTVGLWCALHGESLFAAGMHHLACRVDFGAARAQLAALGLPSMKPFSDYPYLLQCFTEGEPWRVADERIEALLRRDAITADQGKQFRDHGALGSHLELVERNQGFKGFNQHGVDEIIAGTDPRLHASR